MHLAGISHLKGFQVFSMPFWLFYILHSTSSSRKDIGRFRRPILGTLSPEGVRYRLEVASEKRKFFLSDCPSGNKSGAFTYAKRSFGNWATVARRATLNEPLMSSGIIRSRLIFSMKVNEEKA